MGATRRKFEQDFREGAVRLVRATGKPITRVARDLGVNEGTLGNGAALDRRRREDGGGALSEDGLRAAVYDADVSAGSRARLPGERSGPNQVSSAPAIARPSFCMGASTQ